MLPGDRLICAFVKTQSVNAVFKEWPLHITIVPWFRLAKPSSKLAEELQEHYVGSRGFRVTVLNQAQFGYKKRKTVHLVAATELMKLESQTRRLLQSHKAWIVDEADKTRNGFRPHVTVLNTGNLREGSSFQCDRIYIVSQHGSFKQIDSVIRL
jgi:2'-5' RNA ligase